MERILLPAEGAAQYEWIKRHCLSVFAFMSLPLFPGCPAVTPVREDAVVHLILLLFLLSVVILITALAFGMYVGRELRKRALPVMDDDFRRKVIKSFMIKLSVLLLIVIALSLIFKIYRFIPAGDKTVLYELESSLGFRKHAVKWLTLAALDGDREAQYRLGDMLLKGEDGGQDWHEAVYWLWQAAKQFDDRAMSDLSEMHEQGLGVRKDSDAARYWSYRAGETRAKRTNQRFIMRSLDFEYRISVWEDYVKAPFAGVPDVLKEYLRKGGSINAMDADGNTALLHAVIADKPQIVEFLVEKGIDKEVVNYEGFTALSLAVKNRKLDLVKLLVENGADVNHAGRQGMTPLHRAVTEGNADAARYLLAHGADINAKTKSGMTVLQLAGKAGRKDLELMLREAGAKE